jgi:hypothetical protein
LCEATAELVGVAATIDALCDSSMPSIELIEANRAIHSALIALGALGALENAPPSDPLSRNQRITPRKGDIGRRSVARRPAVPLGSTPISILYDDLLVPMRGLIDGDQARPAGTTGARRE